jgi:hypothetical protein
MKYREIFICEYPDSPVPAKSCMSKLTKKWQTRRSLLDKTHYCKKTLLSDE